MTYIFVLCIFGDETTTKFEEIHLAIGKCKWNEFPIEIQKLLPLVLRVAQEPIYLGGYMNVRCTRPFMKEVSKQSIRFDSEYAILSL